MRRRISLQSGLAVPQSFITKGKQRLKQNIDTVYMNNGEEFEIELYNPTQNKVLAKIEMNGNSIGNGIILRPGERVFLERYFDEAKKFLFETYKVNGDNQEVQNAIAKNGDVTVSFYNEYKQPTVISNITTNVTNPYWYTPISGSFTTTGGVGTYNTTTVGNVNYSTLSETYTTNSASSSSFNVSGSLTSNSVKPTLGKKTKEIETGRVEKGSNSDQSFVYDNSSFEYFSFHTNWWKIKPMQDKSITKEDLVVYCGECGAKRKKDNHKFCPHCGNKY
jgi:hypothetical protein